MTLHVPFEQFAETATRLFGHCDVFLSVTHRGTVATAIHSTQQRMVTANTSLEIKTCKAKLEKAGLKVFEGAWSQDGEEPGEEREFGDLHIAAVAYLAENGLPGVLVDAFEGEPTEVQSLRTIYEEFRSTGEVADVSFEEFVRLAKPTVAIVTPMEIGHYLEAKKGDC